MAARAGTLSPVSPESSDWSGLSRYQSMKNTDPQTTANPRGGGLVSRGSTGGYNDGAVPAGLARRPGDPPGNPSPTSSVARSSDGVGLSPSDEESLQEHYVALKRFLANFLRGEAGNPRSNRAKDKLLRLSAVQFHELSTDVYDELLRRQTASGARRSGPGGVVQEGAPPFLIPEDNFHPKRNQARQKLSTLPSPRFRDLATDVFFESERRFPAFTGADMEGAGGAAPNSKGGSGPNVKPAAGRGSSRPGSRGQIPRINDGLSLHSPFDDKPAFAGNGPEYGRPLPKTFQSNTIIPNKSTLVEDDDDTLAPEDGSEYSKRPTEKGSNNSQEFSAGNQPQDQAQVRELQDRIYELEGRLRQKDDQLSKLELSEKHAKDSSQLKSEEWADIQADLEDKLGEAQSLNQSLHSELEKLRAVNGNSQISRDQQRQTNSVIQGDESELRMQYEALQRLHEQLKMDLQDQQQVTEEVRRSASTFLQEMKALSDQCSASWEKEEVLLARVAQLEKEVEVWKNRYARAKTQRRNLRVSSVGPPLQLPDVKEYATDGRFVSPDGRVRHVHVTKFQIAIDELLHVARGDDLSSVTEYMKTVIVCTRYITQDVGEAPPGNEDYAAQLSKLKSRVSNFANNLITASKELVSSNGLSPVALLDAAASHLTAAVVELIQLVKVRPSSSDELENEEGDSVIHGDSSAETSPVQNGRFSEQSDYGSTAFSKRGPSNDFQGNGRDNWSSSQPPQEDMPPLNGRKENAISFGYESRGQEVDVEELKLYLEDQVEELVQSIQALVTSIRANAGIPVIRDYINEIAGILGNVVSWTGSAMEEARSPSLQAALQEQGEPILSKLSDYRTLLLNANAEGERISDPASLKEYTNRLPPLAFEISRETKQLIQRMKQVDHGKDGAERDRFR